MPDPRCGRPWIDRATFKVDGIRFRWAQPGLSDYLQIRRQVDQPFKHSRRGDSHLLEFSNRAWLFNAKIKLEPLRAPSRESDTGVYTGTATIHLNPTRLLAHMGPRARGPGIDAVEPDDLIPERTRDATLKGLTLDGNANVVPDELVALALRTDWPRFVEAYASAVIAVIQLTLGTDNDASENGLGGAVPLIILPAPHLWALRQIEVYREYRCADATEAVHQIEMRAHGASRALAGRSYPQESEGRPGSGRDRNSRSITVDIGNSDLTVAAYAKTLERLRIEVRYKKNIGRTCRIRLQEYRSEPGGCSALIGDVGDAAMRRLQDWFSALQHDSATRPQNRMLFFMLVASIHAACGGDTMTAARVWGLLVANRGIYPDVPRELEQVGDALIACGVLERAPGRHRNLRLCSAYAPYVAVMERLDEEFRRTSPHLRPTMGHTLGRRGADPVPETEEPGNAR